MSSQPSPLGKPLGVGVFGYGFMGIVHSSALLRLPQLFPDIGLSPQLVAMAGRDAEKLTQVAGRFGYTRLYRDWEQLVADPDVGLLDNSGPNYLHAEPCIAAARAGKHLLCEKPLARSATEAWQMLEAAQSAGVVHMCGFNYRFVPAIQLARRVIAEGRLGKIYHFRAHYLQPSLVDPSTPVRWRMSQEQSGYGVLGDLGSHI
ncbi:MAG TPA: Gfo/Idh/MocA family oxidoreductase, partial [Chloroflexota bacterium]|nr:Gfo/Idh/MocA family oxidoreductase [Chloroflexota bacterium]